MAIYLICFITSLLAIHIANKTKKHKIISSVATILALAIPCFLAAFRNYSVGTDTMVYQVPAFEKAGTYASILDWLNYRHFSEPLYWGMTWLIAKSGSPVGVLFFTIELLCIVPIYFALKNKHDSAKVLAGLFIYYFFFYNRTLNLARQSIAISFSILSLSLIDRKKIGQSAISFLIAFLFHTSSIVMIPIFLLRNVLYSNKISNSWKKLLLSFIVVGVLALILNYERILPLIGQMEILGDNAEKYSSYGENYAAGSFSLKWFLWWLCLILILKFSTNKKTTREQTFYFGTAIIFLLGFVMQSKISYTERVFYYFGYPFLVFIVPEVLGAKTCNKNQLLIKAMLVSLIIFYWVDYYAIDGACETIPYLFIGSN